MDIVSYVNESFLRPHSSPTICNSLSDKTGVNMLFHTGRHA